MTDYERKKIRLAGDRLSAFRLLRSLNRPSSNGHEASVILVYHTSTRYSWDLVRYPLDPHDTTPTETLVSGEHRTWPEMAEAARDYLNQHRDDGFFFQ